MYIWISRDKVRFISDSVYFWSEKPYYEWEQSWVNNKDGQMSIGYIGRMRIEEFEKCLEFDKWLITDKYNRMNKNPYFNDNRHDQSISSIIRKKIGSIVIEGDESWFPPFGQGKSLDYPFWATRSRS